MTPEILYVLFLYMKKFFLLKNKKSMCKKCIQGFYKALPNSQIVIDFPFLQPNIPSDDYVLARLFKHVYTNIGFEWRNS